MLPSPNAYRLGLWGFAHFEVTLRSRLLRPDDSLTIPKMALSVGFRNSLPFLPATQATRVLTIPSVGLSPTERASLRWTHTRSLRFPRSGGRVWCVHGSGSFHGRLRGDYAVKAFGHRGRSTARRPVLRAPFGDLVPCHDGPCATSSGKLRDERPYKGDASTAGRAGRRWP